MKRNIIERPSNQRLRLTLRQTMQLDVAFLRLRNTFVRRNFPQRNACKKMLVIFLKKKLTRFTRHASEKVHSMRIQENDEKKTKQPKSSHPKQSKSENKINFLFFYKRVFY